jgi:hypothetical protein
VQESLPGTFRKCHNVRYVVAFGRKADVARTAHFGGVDPERTSIFRAETKSESGRRDGLRPRTQIFQINDHLAGALVDGVAGAGLATP